MSEPLLNETREADAIEKMNALAGNLQYIAGRLGDVIKNFKPNDEETKKEVIEIINKFKVLNKEYKLKDFFRILKSYSDDELNKIRDGVSKMFSDSDSNIIVDKEENTVTIDSPVGKNIISGKDLILEETCNPMHQHGSSRRKQYGGVFDPFTVFAMGTAGAAGTAVAITVMIALSFIYLAICLLTYTGALPGGYTLLLLGPCIPVGLLLFLNSVRKDIKNSCSSRKGGKLKTARKRFLIKKHRISKRKKSKKSRK